MREDRINKSLIIQHFKDFYQELVILKAKALSGDLISKSSVDQKVTGVQNMDENLMGKSMAREILDRMQGFLLNQYDYVERHGGGFAVKYYREVQYIMVALTDEVFLNLDWIGKSEWEDNLLESRIFNTQVAGERLFENIDHFLEVRDAANSDVGVLYIIVLGLGFKGKYKDLNDHGIIQEYRKKLYARVMHDTPYLLEETHLLFPQAYQSTIDERSAIKMPNLRAWYMALGYIFGVFLLVSSALWFVATRNVTITLVSLEKIWLDKK
jgi:type VI secretion system protein ImpK